ncbi:MAG: FUSC family protein [bacterium]|nr:FUSC family protein [bacterium]
MSIHWFSDEKIIALQHAFSVSIAFSIACIICFSYNILIFHGYWLPMTVLLMFSAPIQGSIKKRSSDRILGTIIGIFFSFFILNIFLYSNYRWVYMLVFILFFANYIFIMSGNYFIAVIFITAFVPSIFDVLHQNTYYKLDNTLVLRLFLTAIGIAIAYLCEMTIYKKASLSTKNAKYHSRYYFKTISEIITLSSECFINKNNKKKELIDKLKLMSKTVSSIENIFLNIRYETDYQTNNNSILCEILFTINKIDCSLRRMMCILLNSEYEETVIKKKQFEQLIINVSDKFINFKGYVNGETKNEIIYPLCLVKSINITPTHLYTGEIYELNNLFDNLTKNISMLNKV